MFFQWNLGREAKKLIAAARFWARGGKAAGQDEQFAADAAAFGIELPAREIESDDFELWRDNLPTWEVFMAMKSQWNWLATMESVRRTGLNYPALESALRVKVKKKDRAAIFADLQAMEWAALEVFNDSL